MRITARAKINWTLDVLGTRDDGYHELDTVMQPISLHDTLTFAPADSLHLSVDGVAPNENNLVLKAARALKAFCGTTHGADIRLEKRIPLCAGLGGGSADAAATLKALNKLWELGLSFDTLSQIALTLGADVPFCLMDAPARARGIGERLSPVDSRLCCPLVLVQPCAGLLTKDVFARFTPLPKPLDMDEAVAALESGDLARLSTCAGNALLPAATSMQPILTNTISDLYARGATFAQMTGSGSVVFGAFEQASQADSAAQALKERYPVVLRAEAVV